KIVPNTIKTIPKVPLSPISKSKSFQEKLNDIQNNIDIDIDDIPEDLLDIWDELQEDITPKLISKNYKLWLTIFTPFILPGIINGMSGKPSVPQPVVTVQEPAPDPKQIVNFAQKYFAEHGLELCKSLTKTDLNNIKQDLINNWGKGPDAFSKAFQDSYPVSKARLENIYRSERHIAEYHGVLERAKIADHKYKQWRAVGDERSCDLCMSHDMETVPINEPFSNGEMTATGHPQCRCSMVTYSDEDYNEMKEDSAYLDDVVNTIKLNYNCPDSEKIGSGPGSCGGNKPNEKHEPEKPTNIATTKNKKIASFISNALQEDPRRMFHGYIPKKGKLLTTNDTGFWLDSEGKSYVHKKLVDIPENKRNDLINVHSHAGQDTEQRIVNKKDVADFKGIESFSGGDFQMLQFNIKNGYGRKIAVIVAPDEYDYFEVPEKKLGEFIKIKDIANKFEAHSSSLEESRKFLMEISNKNGFIYRPAIKFEQKQDSSYLADAFET
ncbi:MAG TPA: phage minor head protein, partial [Planctomycetota bacterium]|nr:phage minor head protein [Planctomycetota bacterium]